jgi:hypothetical protein
LDRKVLHPDAIQPAARELEFIDLISLIKRTQPGHVLIEQVRGQVAEPFPLVLAEQFPLALL